MKERAILFYGAMVRAILAGQKTQTRRSVRMVTRSYTIDYRGPAGDTANPANWGFEDENGREWALAKDEDVDFVIPCKYGQAGDLLVGRETVFINHYMGLRIPEAERADCELFYRATDEDSIKNMEDTEGLRWTPSIHMPRWTCRLLLPLLGVRVERLQKISESDALAEGIVQLHAGGYGLPAGEHYHSSDPRHSYFSLWEAINGPGSVDADPWAHVLTFPKQEATNV